jgi:hypothetical protein
MLLGFPFVVYSLLIFLFFVFIFLKYVYRENIVPVVRAATIRLGSAEWDHPKENYELIGYFSADYPMSE